MNTEIFTKIKIFGLELNPLKEFAIGSLSIRMYGVIIAVGLLLAVIYGLKRGKEFGLKEDDILDGVLGIVPLAIVCARLFYCAFEWSDYAANPIRVLYIWEGGLAIAGGIIGAVIGVVIFCYVKKVRLGAVLDITLLAFLIGQCIGRWGNFFNREAFGAATDGFFKMGLFNSKTLEYEFYHPTFLYESLWTLCGFVALHFLSKKRQYDGQIALGYLLWYGMGRTLIEGLRMDSLYIPGTQLRVNQLLAAVACFVAGVVLVVQTFRTHDRKKLFVNQLAEKEAMLAVLEEEDDEDEDENVGDEDEIAPSENEDN